MPAPTALRILVVTTAGCALTACGDPLALVPLLPPKTTVETVDSADTALPAQAVELSEMPLPPGRTLWSWDIIGQARITDPGTTDAAWTGSATWIWQDVSTGTEACIAELQTVGDGQDDGCAPEDGCLFGLNIEHTLTTFDGPDGCFEKLGLPDVEGPLDRWGLGYADTWDDGSSAGEHTVLYLWSRDSKTFPGAWRPMGTATWDEEGEAFSYTFETLWFFVVEG